MKEVKCVHRHCEVHRHGRRGFPFGKKSKPFFYGVKKITVHCKDCKSILLEKKK